MKKLLLALFLIPIILISQDYNYFSKVIKKDGIIFSISYDTEANSYMISIKNDNIKFKSKIPIKLINDVTIEDLGEDNILEILIYTPEKSKILVYQFNNGNLNRIKIPKVSEEISKYYRGFDQWDIKDNHIRRIFPAYTTNDGIDNTSMGKYSIIYKILSSSLLPVSTQLENPSPSFFSKSLIITVTSIDVFNPEMDLLTEADIFYTLFVGKKEMYISDVTWNVKAIKAQKKITINNYDKENITIHVFDKDEYLSNDKIGSITITQPKSGIYNLKNIMSDGSTKNTGKIELKID